MLAVALDLRSIAPPQDSARPEISLTPAIVYKAAGSIAMTAMGMYYLMSGKERKDVQRMFLGALLIVGAFFVF